MNFKTWQAIKLGTALQTPDDFRTALKDAGCRIEPDLDRALGSLVTLTVAPKEIVVELVNVSVGELGCCEIHNSWDDVASFDEIYGRAQELGLALCPMEVGFQLRLKYLDQPKGKLRPPYEKLLIAMQQILIMPVGTWGYGPRVLTLLHDYEGLWLNTHTAKPDEIRHRDDRFIFLRQKQSP